jgi:transaldolase
MSASDLARFGTSIWLDDLSRAKISGTDPHSLPARIKGASVVGVTTNPSIFSAAISGAEEYSADIARLKGSTADAIVRQLTTDDVRAACDLFTDIYIKSHGIDGRVSIEVDPRLAHNTAGTIGDGKELYKIVDRPNVMIKVPATLEGLPAITALIAEGISVNVTLIFSVERYALVIDAFMKGIEEAKQRGLTLSSIHSVASFFVSRIDTAIDPLLEKLGATALQGKAAVANAHIAYELFLKQRESERWKALASDGAHMQRPLWASTGVKNPNYEDTRYVVELVAADCVNTMPQSTLDALIDHGVVRGDSITGAIAQSHADIQEIEAAGISLATVTAELEAKGLKSFAESWEVLLASVNEVSQK